jgi:hypothetical protein
MSDPRHGSASRGGCGGTGRLPICNERYVYHSATPRPPLFVRVHLGQGDSTEVQRVRSHRQKVAKALRDSLQTERSANWQRQCQSHGRASVFSSSTELKRFGFAAKLGYVLDGFGTCHHKTQASPPRSRHIPLRGSEECPGARRTRTPPRKLPHTRLQDHLNLENEVAPPWRSPSGVLQVPPRSRVERGTPHAPIGPHRREPPQQCVGEPSNPLPKLPHANPHLCG